MSKASKQLETNSCVFDIKGMKKAEMKFPLSMPHTVGDETKEEKKNKKRKINFRFKRNEGSS